MSLRLIAETLRRAAHAHTWSGWITRTVSVSPERRDVDEPGLCPETYTHDVWPSELQRLPATNRGGFSNLCRRDVLQEAHGAVRRGHRRVVPRDLDRVQ